MFDVAVIGGGAAGMMAAGTVATSHASVVLIEKNEKLGKKLHITGKGRCNLTNNTDISSLLEHVLTNPRFLQSSFHAMDSSDLMNFFETRNLPLKTERGGRVFPVSDKASDVTKVLTAYMQQNNVKIKLKHTVRSIKAKNEHFIINTNQGKIEARAIIIATGGLSYPSTGSTGEGYSFAKELGHNIITTHPSLVPLFVKEPWVADLEGLSLRNVRCTAKLCSVQNDKSNKDGKTVYEELGEMLFTAKGVTGPLILKASAFLTDKLPAKLYIDLKPGLTPEQLDTRILRDFAEFPNKHFLNALEGLLPKRLIETIITLSGISPDKKINEITRNERKELVKLLKSLPLTPIKTAGFREAVITRGGVDVREINPSTLMSKFVKGLFFAGEILDVDAFTGGYNLQIAFSTGYLAGVSVAKYLKGLNKS